MRLRLHILTLMYTQHVDARSTYKYSYYINPAEACPIRSVPLLRLRSYCCACCYAFMSGYEALQVWGGCSSVRQLPDAAGFEHPLQFLAP